MKYSIAVAALVTLSLATFTEALPARRSVSGPPLRPRDDFRHAEILNFALTLEHLESAFYQEALTRYSSSDFAAAGFPDWVRGRFEQIRDHEATHVTFLSTALATAGAQAVKPCEYNFPITDSVQSFVDLSAILENVGAAAYTGSAHRIHDKNYLTVAASILAVESRHAAWIDSAPKKSNAWNSAFETPLALGQVYSLAVPFIKSCPASNAASLPALTAYPALTVTDAHPGKVATLVFTAPTAPTELFAAFISGAGAPVFVPIQDGNTVTIPSGLLGFVFCVVTKDGGMVDESTTVAGPTILNFAFDSRGQVV
ncbi:ferritin-like domain-containing protein [Mycena vitilis]|nr:ferritin-like domain-containing protein [Mycena vitilis]